MKAKIKGVSSSRSREVTKYGDGLYQDVDGTIFKESDLDFDAPEKAVIEGYVARDKNGEIILYQDMPKRGKTQWVDSFVMKHLSDESFPSIAWESDPKRVRIEITLLDGKEGE